MKEHIVVGLEGIDGSGKSTAGKLIAAETGARYFYCMDGNPLTPHRKRFDTMPTPIRYLYYVGVPLLNYSKVEKWRQKSDVLIDRSVASTLAYHKAYGLPDYWFKLIPPFLLNQVDLMMYFEASEEERKRRVLGRAITTETMTVSDQKSFEFAGKIDAAYRTIFTDRTIFISTDDKSPEEVTKEAIARLGAFKNKI